MPGGPSELRVEGTCRFYQGGWSADLVEGNADDPENLELFVATAAPGGVPEVITEIPVKLVIPNPAHDYATVTVRDGSDRNNLIVLDVEVVSRESEALADGWHLLDWDLAEVHPMIAGGWMLVVTGTSEIPIEVELFVLPVGIAPADYRGVIVRVRPSGDATAQVETKWEATLDVSHLGNFVLIGATKRLHFPSQASSSGS
jgi:hypothetical protein